MKVKIKSSMKSSYWYSAFPGAVFQAKPVKKRVSGHVHSLVVFEVVGGEFHGDNILQGDCEVVRDA